MEGTLREIVENKTLKFVFVGGKGGVGKTTTASSLALDLAQRRGKTLIISTDPAHNLSDSFNQQFSHEPTPVEGVPNLSAMEINPKKALEMLSDQLLDKQDSQFGLNNETGSFMEKILSSFPGIDEASVFLKLIAMAKEMEAEVVVFDTAPTGHTLKLLSFPQTMTEALSKVESIKEKLGPILGLLGSESDQNSSINNIFAKLNEMKEQSINLKNLLTDPLITTFVAVCIPEFLSVYETERLVQELTIQDIDICNLVVNQVVYPEKESNCKKCISRAKMQKKYISQIQDLYSDFHVVLMMQEDNEIRGVSDLRRYGESLLSEKKAPLTD